MEIINLASFAVGILGLSLAYIEWKERIKVEELWLSEVRDLWDIARSYSIDATKINSFFNKETDINAVLQKLIKMNTALNIIFRNTAPIYVRLMGKKMNYETIKCMIVANEIKTVYSLRILLQNLPTQARNMKKEKKLFYLLRKSTYRVEKTITLLKESQYNESKKRNDMYNNSKSFFN